VDLTTSVKECALRLGFDAVGVADLSRNEHAEHLMNWLSSGMAGTMTYMQRQAKRRIEPSRILPGADRAIVVTRNYFNPDPQMPEGTGRVAKYARGPDYHDTLQIPLQELVEHVRRIGDDETIARAYVDAGPVPERELAYRAGLGWIGRNTMLIHPEYGSHLFLAVVLTNLDLAIDRPFPHDRCGTCRRCIDACPTGAINEDRMIDSRKCISYLTIEFTGVVAEELRSKMGNWIFGCDLCQNVCPWNVKFAVNADDPVLSLKNDRGAESLEDLVDMSRSEFGRRFAGTALERAGFEGIRRNARNAMRNLYSA
jgi:epoxyqueuosine reductase